MRFGKACVDGKLLNFSWERSPVASWFPLLPVLLVKPLWYCHAQNSFPVGEVAFKCWLFAGTRGKPLLESWGTTFLSDWQPHLIFVWFTWKWHEHPIPKWIDWSQKRCPSEICAFLESSNYTDAKKKNLKSWCTHSILHVFFKKRIFFEKIFFV